jgi:hypothetical protein
VLRGWRAPARRAPSNDAYLGAYIQHQRARIYLLVGEPEKALDQLEPLLKLPYYLSSGWLLIDPTFASHKGNQALPTTLPMAADTPGCDQGSGE